MHSLKSLIKAPTRRAFGLSTVAALVLAIGAAPVAQAIPPNQRDFDTNSVRTASSNGVLVPGTFVTVNNDVARLCNIEFAAVMSSTDGDLAAVGYILDSPNPAACVVTGGAPAVHSGALPETHTAKWIRGIGGGLHTIRLCYSVVDRNGGGGTAILSNRSLTVECRTQ